MAYNTPKIVASGTTFSQLQAGGLNAVLDNLLTLNPALADPTTAPTAAATGGGATGGLLAAGTYFLKYTLVNGTGETLPATESSQLTVASTNIPRVTFPALPAGASGRNLYATAVGGATGTEVLYARGITATTFDMTVNTFADANKTPPSANNTALSTMQEGFLRLKGGDISLNVQRFRDVLSSFLSGRPTGQAESLSHLFRFASTIKAWQAAIDEVCTLIEANTGTLGATSRTFP